MKYVFNLGCGPIGGLPLPAFFDNWRQVRVDIDPTVSPDLLADLTDLSPIASGMADAVFASHCIEHLYPHDILTSLREIHRILQPDGFAMLIVPDLQAVAQYITADRMHETIYESPAGPITAHDMVYGFGPELSLGHVNMAHRSGFTPTLMTERLEKAGFPAFGVVRKTSLELVAIASREPWLSEAYGEELFRRLGL